MTEQHRINYKNIGMIMVLGLLAINVGMSQYRPVEVNIKVPPLLSNQITASSITVNQTFVQNSMSLTSFTSVITVIGLIAIIVVVSFFIYALMGLGGMGGRR
jgi:hypothetical protein